ncbi:MAG: hypothetical protein EOO61_17460 [Hymenobacter sp.]|nr:MAG: hypothetical protein EOO61_17460 [Hymenobacter sp.]
MPVNAFFTSRIKERIVMINTERPNFSKGYKYLLLVPVALGMSVLVGFEKDKTVLTHRTVLLLKPVPEKTNTPMVTSKLQVFSKSSKQDKHIKYKLAMPLANHIKPKQYGSMITIDARTDTVKFSLVPDSLGRKFKGIYVIEDNIMTDDELRTAMDSDGKLQMILSNRPVIGIYTPNDSTAVRRWGEQARAGVVFVKARTGKLNR